jgi:D-amino-acid dehydrogenase
MKVAVVGAGIAGLTAAYYLAKDGFEVIIFDSERHPAMKCSYANGGQVSVSNSEVWTTWSNVLKGAKWIFKKDAPLLMRPSLNWDKAAWLAKFLYHTANNDYARNTAETIRMGINSRKALVDIQTKENIDYDYSHDGILHFYKNKQYFQQAVRAQEIYQSNGCEWDILSPLQVKSLDPALADVKDLVGGTYTSSDFVGDIHKFCTGLANVLETKYNVKFCYNTVIDDIADLDLFPLVIIASGTGSQRLARSVGDNLGIYPIKGYSITVMDVDKKLLPSVSLLDDESKIVTSTLGNKLRIAGTAELAGENYDITRSRIEPLLKWVNNNFPKINTHNYSSWACLRPMTPNMMPIVRRSRKNPKVYYHTGHGHLGWTLSAGTAKVLSNIIKGDINESK